MTINLDAFNKKIEAEKKKLAKKAKLMIDAVATDVFRDIVAISGSNTRGVGSPIWSGQYVASHRVSVNRPDSSVSGKNPAFAGLSWPNTGSSTLRPTPIGFITNILRTARLGDSVFISNNLPYARRIEKGHSQQTPQGVYKVAVAAVRIKYANKGLRIKVTQ